MDLLITLLAGMLVFIGYLVTDKLVVSKQRKESLRARLTPDGGYDQYGDEAPRSLTGEPSPLAASLTRLLSSLGVDMEESSRALELRFANAGISSPDAPAIYVFCERLGSVFVLMAAVLMWLNANGDDALTMKGAALLLAVIALRGPKLFVQNLIDKRKKILQRAFPDTLDLMLICVESGLALDAALNRVCNELGRAYPEMTAELNRTRMELALLNDRVRALMNLAARTDMPAFRSLVSALVQSERFGTSLTDTLRVLSEDFRLERLAAAEAKAARLPVLMTLPLMLFLMPSFFIIVLGPAIISIMHTSW